LDFLNVGPWELVVVLIIAILVAGPKRMVEIARTLGQFSRQLRDLSREFTMALQAEIQATEEQAGAAGADLREVQRDLQDVLAGSPPPESDTDDESDVPSVEDA
jgi:Tat protein translocase TatB subunit